MSGNRKHYFPMFVDLTDKKVVVAGAGTIAKRRIRTLVKFTDELIVVAPEVNQELKQMQEEGKLTILKMCIRDRSYTVRELASQEMKNSAGATWDAATAGNAIGTWSSSFGDQIDVVVSNNDGMGMSMFNAWSKDNKVPTFGYDANNDAVAALSLIHI